MIKDHLSLLGLKVKDQISGAEGVVDSICFDLYGCVQASVRPAFDKKKNAHPPGHWYDVKRLKILDKKPVMSPPDFDKPEIGAADKPARRP